MNALEAGEKLKELDERIEALNAAYTELWRDFDNRWIAVRLNKIQAELEGERAEISDKLRSVKL